MSDAAAHIARLDRAIGRAGDTVTLRRLLIDPNGVEQIETEVSIPAWVRDSQPQDLIIGDDVADIAVVVSATGLANFGLPERDERIEVNGRPANVQKAATIYRGGELVRVNLFCRGSGG